MTLTLDLSTKSSGYAIFDDNKQLLNYGCITASGNDLIKRIKKITGEIDILLSQYPINKIVIEEVMIQTGVQTKTYRALMYMQAALMFLLYDKHNKIEIETIYPSSWRAKCGIRTGRGIKREQLKKEDIKFVNETYGIEITNDDIADAIGIGHSYVNDLKDELNW